MRDLRPVQVGHAALVLVAALCLPACSSFDDRARVAAAIYFCNPSSVNADVDCGAGYTCYAATQSIGQSFCVPSCGGKDAKPCNGSCTAGGECLQRCKVGDATSCPLALTCVRSTISPKDTGPDGVCLAVSSGCASTDDCTSAIFNTCSSEVAGGDAEHSTGSVCIQGGCGATDTACEPGSSCLGRVLPAGLNAPDVCAPDCLTRKDLDGNVIALECLIGYTCMGVNFPQTRLKVCAPGYPGWRCVDDLGCIVGDCNGWEDVAPSMAAFRTCGAPCGTDDDCVFFDQGNPSFITKMTCENQHCRSLQSFFYPATCFHAGDACQLDPAARCAIATVPPPPPPPADGGVPDGGDPNPTTCLAAGGAPTPFLVAGCVRDCSKPSDCDTLSMKTSLPHACTPNFGTDGGTCQPEVPFIRACVDDSACLGGLTCELLPSGARGCTQKCAVSDDCKKNPLLGSLFACPQGFNLCVPRTEGGCPPAFPIDDLCLGQKIKGGLCVNPKGWSCYSEWQCESGSCTGGRCD